MDRKLRNAQITQTHLAVPTQSQSATEIASELGCDAQWVLDNVGVATRYVGRPGDDPCELAAAAARPVIDRAGTPDCVLYASATVRQFLPDTSVFVSRALGLSGVPSFSVHATCLSFVVALNQASLMIRAGQYERILIVCAELSTQSRDMDHPESAALLGDGAAAVMIEATDQDCGLRHFSHKTWPEYAELSQISGGGLLKNPNHYGVVEADYLFAMDGERLLRTTMPKLRRFLKDFYQQAGMTSDSIDVVVPHQASAAGMKLVRHCGLDPSKTVSILNDYGNCVSASIPMALAVANRQEKLKRGDQVLFLGSAAGLSLGALLWRW